MKREVERAKKIEKKGAYFTRVQGYLGNYKSCFIVHYDHVGSKQIAEIRMALRGAKGKPDRGVMLCGKNTMIRKAFSIFLENNPGNEYANLLPKIYGNIALIFTNDDLGTIAELIKENKKLAQLLMNPVVDAEKKRAVLAKIGKEAGFNQYTNNFLNLLVEKDRLAILDQICESFEDQYCKLTDTQVAVVRSAVKLEQEQQFLIAKKLQELTGSKNIKLRPVIDQSLIAGFVVEYGSSQIDLSIRNQIARVAEQLTTEMTAKMA